MTPFAEIADTFDAIGIGQDLQSCGNLFIADRHGKFLAALRDQNDHHRGLLPPRLQQREIMPSRSASVTDVGKRT